MSDFALALGSFPLLLLLIFLRAPIGLAMLVLGAGGLWALSGSPQLWLAKMKNEGVSTFANYELSVIPMFLLMGQFATQGGMSRALFRAADALIGHRRGGVAMAAIGACAGFGAICGSSLATAATMSRVALPEMKAAGYSGALSTAALAAGGTLGILIPPSIVLVIFAILTEQNIATLFAAALLPGLLAVAGYGCAVRVYLWRHPGAAGHPRAASPWSARRAALWATWPVVTIFALVVGGIYGGIFSPTEGAAIGAALTGLAAWASGGLRDGGWITALRETAQTTGMVFFIILGAAVYNGFLGFARLPQELAELIVGQGISPWLVLGAMLVLYLVLGCFMDSLSMILLTLPTFWPIVVGLDFGMDPQALALWFGVLVLIVVEVGLITPPVGLNLFVIAAIEGETPAPQTWRAVVWFVAADLLRVALILALPALTLLPLWFG
ncbi:C4-dicarboxylate ABC transporter permease [Thioclava dalianensis]|uniref:TRAP transporter large permease protein n=1 Tax=Thioclava dalianensis TaxID=1185766 RepID=A0A074U9J3_9RHOB|nr:TRAP transporter large permease [Thioclava dalianensis]KEP71342.1 C4-dicarboxylate ABC transporter permease [Thioclava dalianensis]SFM77789.1 TRAP transporter, DctM subunit [Thioclava dalianensis]